MSGAAHLLRVVAEGGRVRRAAGRIDDLHDGLAAALRRAVPFLGRRATPIQVTGANAEKLGDTLSSLPRPHFVVPLACAPSASPGALAFDGDAVSLLLDGLLGGNGQTPPMLSPDGLSGAQVALVSRVAAGIVSAFGEVLAPLGVSLGAVPAAAPRKHDADPSSEAIPIVVHLQFGADASVGHILLVLPKDALATRTLVFAPATTPRDARVVAAVSKVEVELVAELGHRRMRISDLGRLKVGDTLRFSTRVDGTASVRIGDRALFTARPTAQNGQIALRVATRTFGVTAEPEPMPPPSGTVKSAAPATPGTPPTVVAGTGTGKSG